MHQSMLAIVVALASSSASVAEQHAPRPRYSITVLGVFTPYALNNLGTVAGDTGTVGYFWSDGLLTNIGTLGGPRTHVKGMNDRNVVIGLSNLPGDNQMTAFSWQNGRMTQLTFLGDDRPADINDSGQVVGEISVGGLAGNAFLWNGTSLIDLGTTAEFHETSEAKDVSDRGDVVGDSGLSCIDAFLWRDGELIALPKLSGCDCSIPYCHCWGQGVNNLGVVVGSCNAVVEPGFHSGDHACLWPTPETVIDLGVLPGFDSSTAWAINDTGAVIVNNFVGTIFDGTWRAAVWLGGTLHDLSDCIDPDSGWSIRIAYDINNAGQIAATATTSTVFRALLLTPIPPADLTWDGLVNAADLAAMLGAWGPCEDCDADLNADGLINAADLGALLGSWTVDAAR